MSETETIMVSIADAAKFLGVTANTLRAWEAKGKLSSTRTIGGHRRYSMAALEELQAAHRN